MASSTLATPGGSLENVLLQGATTTCVGCVIWSGENRTSIGMMTTQSYCFFSGSVTNELWEIYHIENVLAPLYVTLTVMTNGILLAHEARVVWSTKRLNPPKLLVLALATADLLATVVGFLPLWLLSSHYLPTVAASVSTSSSSLGQPTTATPNPDRTASPGPTNCTLVNNLPGGIACTAARHFGYLVTFFMLTTFWTLAQCIVVVMGIERFMALRAAYFYAARCTCRMFLLVLGSLVLASSILATCLVFVHTEEVRADPVFAFAGLLHSRFLGHDAFSLMQGIVWMVVLLACNLAVTRELHRMESSVTVMRAKDQSEYLKQLSLIHGSGREFSRLMMTVNVVFLLSCLPYLVCLLLRMGHRAPSFAAQYFCWRMSHVSALLNPFLYSFLRKSLRNRIRHVFGNCLPFLRSNRVGDAESQTVRYNVGMKRPSSSIMPRDPEASTLQINE